MRRILWDGWHVSAWRPWSQSIYSIYYYIHTIYQTCILSNWNKLFLRTLNMLPSDSFMSNLDFRALASQPPPPPTPTHPHPTPPPTPPPPPHRPLLTHTHTGIYIPQRINGPRPRSKFCCFRSLHCRVRTLGNFHVRPSSSTRGTCRHIASTATDGACKVGLFHFTHIPPEMAKRTLNGNHHLGFTLCSLILVTLYFASISNVTHTT